MHKEFKTPICDRVVRKQLLIVKSKRDLKMRRKTVIETVMNSLDSYEDTISD